MRTPFDGFGAQGVIFDQPPWQLADAAWSDAVNFRFRDGAAESFSGQSQVFGTPLGEPLRLFTGSDGLQNFWVYAGRNAVWATDGGVHADISSVSVSYSASDALLWNGGPFQRHILINNGLEAPQTWLPNLANRMTEIPAWETGLRADVIRTFRNYVFALRCTEDGTYNPRLLRHSNGAIAGQLPTSWDYTDPNEDTGRVEFGQTDDLLVDALPMRDQFVIYKQRHIWSCQYVGGVDNPFIYRQAFSNAGALSQYCIANFEGNHIVLSPDDVLIHDLNQINSIIDKKVRSWLFRQINADAFQTCFVVAHQKEREIWICFPESGHDRPNMALVWNWSENTFSPRNLGVDVPHMAFGIVQQTSGGTFDTDTDGDGTFDGATGTIDGDIPSGANTSLLLADPANTLLLRVDSSGTLNGSPFTKRLDRIALPFGDLIGVKRIHRIFPKLIGTPGEVVRIQVGVRERFEDAFNWGAAVSFTIGTDLWAEFRTAGRLIDVRFEYDGIQSLRLHGFDVEWEPAGLR